MGVSVAPSAIVEGAGWGSLVRGRERPFTCKFANPVQKKKKHVLSLPMKRYLHALQPMKRLLLM